MTVQDNTPWVQVTSSGSSNEAFDFLVFGSSDLEVYIGSSAQSSGTWDIIAQTGGANAGLSPDTGGQVQFSTAPTTGNVITIFRDLARQRTTNFQPGGNINVPTLNDQLDRHTLYQAEDEFDMSRGIHMAPWDTDIASTGMEMPDATTRANLVMAWTSTGAVTAVAGSTQVTVGDLGDVVLSGPADNDVIVYESTSTAWIDRTFGSSALLAVTHSTDDVTIGFDVSTGSTGDVPVITSTGIIWANPALGSTGLSNVVEDTTPQLGGALDINAQDIVSTDGVDITLTPGTTAQIILDGQRWPQAIGTTGQILTVGSTLDPEWATAPGAAQIDFSARNISGGTISRGQPVFASGFHAGSTSVQIDLANADSTATMPCIGLVESTEIANNAIGQIAESGLVSDVDTSTSSVDDLLYISATGAGALTATKPTGTALIQRVGQVLRSHASAGQILVFGAGRANDTPNVLSQDLDMNSFSILSTSNLIIDGANARIAVGSTEQIVVIAGTTVTNVVNVHSEGDATEAEFGTHRHSETANVGAVQWFSRSRGDESTELVVQADDSLAIMAAAGHDGTDYEQAARIEMLVDGTPGAGDMPGRIDLQTSSDGGATPATRLSIRNDGEIRVTSTVGITSTTGADLLLEPGTTGQVVLDGQSWPETIGTTGQVLSVSSTSQLAWATDPAKRTWLASPGNIFNTASCDSSVVTMSMNGAVAGQVVTYTAPVAENVLLALSTALGIDVGEVLVENIDQGETVRVVAGTFDTTANIFTVSTADSLATWGTTDSLHLNPTGHAAQIGISLLTHSNTFAPNATSVIVNANFKDTGAAEKGVRFLDPAGTQRAGMLSPVANIRNMQWHITLELEGANKILYFRTDASGAGTIAGQLLVHGYIE